jgi:hypothetical protein
MPEKIFDNSIIGKGGEWPNFSSCFGQGNGDKSILYGANDEIY